MSPSTEQVLRSALSLPRAEQVELIEALIAALDQADPEPFDDTCMAEIHRRSAEFDAGRVIPIPWSVVRQRAQSGDGYDVPLLQARGVFYNEVGGKNT